ncbi:MAG: histidinol-phosphate transaminase [Oceanipulchritudo sp.]
MKSIADRAHEHIQALQAYVPGSQPLGEGWIKLNTNESPFAPPESVLRAISAESASLARYPNPGSVPLREALADHLGLVPEQVLVGNGSDDVLNLLARAFGGRGKLTWQSFPSYSLYPVITAIAGGDIQSIPFDATFRLPLKKLIEARPDLLFLTCPNAPTGVRFPLSELRELAASMEGLLVVDEAYVEFAEASALPLLSEHDNVVVTRTFSKAYGLAGLRVGYLLGSPEAVAILDRIRDSYNVNRLSQAGALAAIREQALYQERISAIKERRHAFAEALAGLGWSVYPSEANFLFAAPVRAGSTGPDVAHELFQHLERRRILVRYFPKHPLTASHLRITIGSELEMDHFLKEVKTWTQGEEDQ